MAVGERQTQKQQRRKTPSFSSSLLDAIYHSIDEQQVHDCVVRKRNNAAQVEEEIENLRRAIMVEKWMENYNNVNKSRHNSPNSSSSTDSSIFSSSETDNPKHRPEMTPKLRALKIYEEVKEPISPGRKIANFINSIFSPRSMKKTRSPQEWGRVRKSSSTKDTTTKNYSSSSSRSNKSVRFCPATSVIVNEDLKVACSISNSMPNIGSQFIKKNIDSFRHLKESEDVDDKSCASSDLFELENIGAYEEELPVYGTTSVRMNQAIANGFIM